MCSVKNSQFVYLIMLFSTFKSALVLELHFSIIFFVKCSTSSTINSISWETDHRWSKSHVHMTLQYSKEPILYCQIEVEVVTAKKKLI